MQREEIKQSLNELADPEVACHSQRFFKTRPGEYGEGDVFLGIRVPQLRCLAKHCQLLPLENIYQLLMSTYHEERLLAVIILVHKAAGWMLREMGNRDIAEEEEFLQKYYQLMPRTMLHLCH